MIDLVTDIHERINWRKTKLTMMVMIVVIDQKMIGYVLMTAVVVVLQVNVMI
jgi:hypothetical protein